MVSSLPHLLVGEARYIPEISRVREVEIFGLSSHGSFNALSRPEPINKHFSTLHHHLDPIPIPQNTDLGERIAVYD